MLETPSWAGSFCIVYVGLALVLVISIVYTTWKVMNSSAKLSLWDIFNLFFPPAFAVLLLLLQFWVCRGALIEGFANAPMQYDNGKIYKVGDVVTKDGVVYIMHVGIGTAGKPPPMPTNWRSLPSANLCSPLPYDNGKIYTAGDVITSVGVTYVMIDGIGLAGYPPPRPNNWTPISADSNTALCGAAAAAAPTDNPNLVINKAPGSPPWSQQVVNPSLVPATVTFGTPITVGTTSPITIKPVDNGVYKSNATYSLGNVVTHNNKTYMNVSWNADKRGAAYSGTYGADPTVDISAWRPVTVTATPTPATPTPATPTPATPTPAVPLSLYVSQDLCKSADGTWTNNMCMF